MTREHRGRTKKMQRSMKTHSGKKEQLCDICGDVGFADALTTCCSCDISHEHIYCMKYNLLKVPKEWFCEACSSSNMKDLPREALSCNKRKTCTKSDSPRMPESTITRNVDKISSSPRSSPFSPPKNYIKVVETGKVRFLPAEDVVALTSGTSNVKAYARRGGLNSQVGSLSAPHYPISRRSPISVAEASKRFSQKESACRSSRPPAPLMVGSAKPSSLQQEVVKTSPQDIPAKEKSNEPKKLDKPAGKVLVMPNEDYVSEKSLYVIPPPKKVRTSVTKTKAVYRAQNASSPLMEAKPSVLPKALPNHHAIKPTWKGSFEILGRISPSTHYEGLRAHPPGVVSRKAYEFSKQMPKMLQFKVHPRGDVWTEIFHIDCPTGDDIALYFLPEDFGSSKEYHCLLEFIEMEDLVMSTSLNGVELIIFTSRQLPMDSQRLNMKFFLWGIFRLLKRQLLSPSVTEETNQVVDMEIDMVGGEDIGRVDYVVEKPILEGNKVLFTIHSQKVKYPISSDLDFQKLNSSKNGDGVVGCRNDEAGRSPNVVSNVHSDQPKTGNITPTFKIKREMSTDFDAPPGFSRTVTLGRVPTVGRNLEHPPGFSKFLKQKEMGDPSEDCDKNEKAVISQNSSKKENTSHSYPAKRVFRESSLPSQKDIKGRESPFISQQVVNHGFPKNSTAPAPTPSTEKGKFQGEHKQFKTDTKKCQLEQCVKKEPMEETDSPRMMSLSRVYMKHEQHIKQEGFGSDFDQRKRR